MSRLTCPFPVLCLNKKHFSPMVIQVSINRSNNPVHVALCFHELCAELGHSLRTDTCELVLPDEPESEFPLFVTWKKQGALRGCIGTFVPQRLLEGIRVFSLRSALKDSRFDPIHAHEIELLECSVSMLLDFEWVDCWEDWEPEFDSFWTGIKRDTVPLIFLKCAETMGPMHRVLAEESWIQRRSILCCVVLCANPAVQEQQSCSVFRRVLGACAT